MKTHRVFLTRHYIAVEWYDVKAETPRKALTLAKRTVNRLKPDVRAEATDNGWQTEDPVTVPRPGAFGRECKQTGKMREVAPGVYASAPAEIVE